MTAAVVLFSGSALPLPFAGPNPFPGWLHRAATLYGWMSRHVDDGTLLRTRIRQAEKRLQSKRRSTGRLPLASRARSAARFEVLSLEAALQAYQAVAAGRMPLAERHYADATWFAREARRLTCWDEAA